MKHVRQGTKCHLRYLRRRKGRSGLSGPDRREPRSRFFSDLDSAVWGAARHLHRQGARAGMVVALVFRDQVLLACALLGAMRMGATPIVLSPNLAAREREDLIAAADAGFLFTDDRRFVSATVPSFGFDAASTQNGTPADELFCEYPDGFGQIIAGSGSTGKTAPDAADPPHAAGAEPDPCQPVPGWSRPALHAGIAAVFCHADRPDAGQPVRRRDLRRVGPEKPTSPRRSKGRVPISCTCRSCTPN
ncbi:AMP-binding protein [Jhaorihella thermophila]